MSTEDIVITPGGLEPSADSAPERPGVRGLADALNAGLAKLDREIVRTFDVPGWETMRLRARSRFDETERQRATSSAKTIALVTEAVELRDENGDWQPVEHGWRGIALLMGRPDATTTEVITRVLDNGARVDVFAAELVDWLVGDRTAVEQALRVD